MPGRGQRSERRDEARATWLTDLHLEPDAEWGKLLEVLLAEGDVLLLGLLGEVEHVRAAEQSVGKRRAGEGNGYAPEQSEAVLFEVGSISLNHAVEPREELLCAVVGVEHDRANVE
jgi:hypothetical protein